MTYIFIGYDILRAAGFYTLLFQKGEGVGEKTTLCTLVKITNYGLQLN